MARPQKFRLTPDEVQVPHNARRLAAFVAEIEEYRKQIERIQADIADLYDDADGEGFDKSIIRKTVARRAKPADEREAEENAIELYALAIEKGLATRAREENTPHDEDGVVLADETQPRASAVTAEPCGLGSLTVAEVGAASTSAQAMPIENSALAPSSGNGVAAIPAPIQPETVNSVPVAKASDEVKAEAICALQGSQERLATPADMEPVSRVGSGRTLPATSEVMDVTAGETAPHSNPRCLGLNDECFLTHSPSHAACWKCQAKLTAKTGVAA